MEVFLCERKLGREAIGDDDLHCFRVVCYALLGNTGVRTEMTDSTLLILQSFFDPLYQFIGQYLVATSYECTTAPTVPRELIPVRAT